MRVLLFTGKGGVGKTTTAAATAVHAARRGTKTLVVSTDSAHTLGDTLDRPLTSRPTELETGLFALQVDGRQRLERGWPDLRGYVLELLDAAGVDAVAAEEVTVLPGADELLALLEVRDQVRDGPWDLVVVDCAATAQTLRLLTLPEVLGWYLDRALPPERRVLRAVRPLVGRSSGLPLPRDPVLEGVHRLRSELADVREVLAAPGTTVRLVLTPEAVVVAEARRALTSLALHGLRVDGVVANRVVPAGADPWRAAWARAQGQVLAEVEASFAPVPVLRSTYRAGEPVGLEALGATGVDLYGPVGTATDPFAGAEGPAPVAVHRRGEELVLELQLPLVDRRDVELARRGDELTVTVGTARRVLALPAALRRCTVEGAALRDGALRVRFRPDPALWRPL